LKEQIAFVDNAAFFKRNIDNVTANPRRYCHQLNRCRSSGELVPIRPVTSPTYPDPTIAIFITRVKRVRQSRGNRADCIEELRRFEARIPPADSTTCLAWCPRSFSAPEEQRAEILPVQRPPALAVGGRCMMR
jgi:hypothetical protein